MWTALSASKGLDASTGPTGWIGVFEPGPTAWECVSAELQAPDFDGVAVLPVEPVRNAAAAGVRAQPGLFQHVTVVAMPFESLAGQAPAVFVKHFPTVVWCVVRIAAAGCRDADCAVIRQTHQMLSLIHI